MSTAEIAETTAAPTPADAPDLSAGVAYLEGRYVA